MSIDRRSEFRPRALILGCAGHGLSEAEAAFFRETDPAGFILFARNVESPAQVRALVAALRAAVGWNAPVLIDQEGGRVQRLRPPHWRSAPPAQRFAELFERDAEAGTRAAWINARLIAADLADLGIDVDCAPVLDIPAEGAHDIIGDRAYGRTADPVAALGRAVCDGLLAGGVLPVIKHLPGHGRARADSHEECPVVETSAEELERTDIEPFRRLADAPFAMTAHVLYTAWDAGRVATLSPVVIEEIVRRKIGFGNCLMSDDLSMKALGGSFLSRAKGSLAAGCDLLLHCNGDAREMAEIAAATPRLAGRALARFEAAIARRPPPQPADPAALVDELDRLLGAAA